MRQWQVKIPAFFNGEMTPNNAGSVVRFLITYCFIVLVNGYAFPVSRTPSIPKPNPCRRALIHGGVWSHSRTRCGASKLTMVEDDWRSFRAKLVSQEKSGEQTTGDGWVYDAGDVVEQGTFILGGSRMEFGFGLRQQYFHKSVMLVLSHTPTFTKGIIVNRPSSRTIDDGWRIWYGGDVQGLSSPPEAQHIVCVHRLSNPAAIRVSRQVISGIYWITFSEAKLLVGEGHASKEDFWLFVGYAGWGRNQLQGEIDRKSWHIAAAHSSVLVEELIAQAKSANTLEAGIGMWEKLMLRIGLSQRVDETKGDFAEIALKEWARVHLTHPRDFLQQVEWAECDMLDSASSDTHRSGVQDEPSRIAGKFSSLLEQGTYPGMLLRAANCTDFMLEKQYLHKSILLVVEDSELATAAIVLNRPSVSRVQFRVRPESGGEGGVRERRILFGGEEMTGKGPVFWLHRCDALKRKGLGRPVGARGELWWCSGDEAVAAMRAGDATEEDLLVVQGMCVWLKGDEAERASEAGAWRGLLLPRAGLLHHMAVGRFHPLPALGPHLWSRLTRLAHVPVPGTPPPAAGGEDLGVGAWEAAVAAGGGVAEGEGAGMGVEEGVFDSPVSRGRAADMALGEWSRSMLGLN